MSMMVWGEMSTLELGQWAERRPGLGEAPGCEESEGHAEKKGDARVSVERKVKSHLLPNPASLATHPASLERTRLCSRPTPEDQP